jgi:predicted RNA-binding Zn-ribbon protein involved in translation (DUF1610 family)
MDDIGNAELFLKNFGLLKEYVPFKISGTLEVIKEEAEHIKEIIPCPVCGSENIKQNTKNNGIMGPGYHSWVVSESCENCGVLLAPQRKLYKKFDRNTII